MKKTMACILAITFVFIICVSCSNEKPLTTTLLNGVDISEYVIVYGANSLDYNRNAADYIQEQIKLKTGVLLTINTDEVESAAHEIIVGETSRTLSEKLDANTKGLEFAILSDDTSIAMEGDYFIVAAAAYYFVHTYITGEFFESEVPREECVNTPIVETPSNYLLLIGDGMGVYQTRMFEYLDTPSGVTTDGEDIFYGYLLPYEAKSRTKSNDSAITDSAAGGTALATGYKTNNGYIGKDKNRNDVMSLTELAISLGMETAVMSTEVLTGATPATFSAHADDRNSTAAIKDSQALLAGAILRSLEDSNNDGINTDTIARVLRLMDGGTNGFFMMYEEAYIDKHCHNNDMMAVYKAMYRFNQAIGQFMEFAFYHPDTFVLITADHECGGLLPDDNGELKFNSNNHTADNVLVFAYGVGAEVFNGRIIENVQIPMAIAKMWGVEDFGDASSEFSALGK